MAETCVGYGSSTVSKITVAPMNFQDQQAVIRSSADTFYVAADRESASIKRIGSIDEIHRLAFNENYTLGKRYSC